MKKTAQYDIDIYGLQNKQYICEFESGDEFFEELNQDLITKGQFKTHLLLNKSETMIILDFEIKGNVELTCDRSLEPFEEPFSLKERLILKFGEKNESFSDEIETIRPDTTKINIGHHVFDYIVLSLPMKRLHPRFRTEENGEELLVYSSSDEEVEEKIDPRWEKLKKLN